MSTRYEHLKGRKDSPKKEMYSGMWHGHLVEFERVFRGHRFTSEECEALCRGELIEVHNLSNKGVLYGVAGGLEESVWQGVSQEFRSVRFKVKTSLINNPHYVYHTPYVEAVSKPQTVDTSFDTDVFSDTLDAEMAAMIASPALPPIQRVESEIPGVAMFVPVLDFANTVKTESIHHVSDVEETHPVWDTLYEQLTEGQSHDVRIEEGLDVDDEDLIDEDEMLSEEEDVSNAEDSHDVDFVDDTHDVYDVENEYDVDDILEDVSNYEEEPPEDMMVEDDIFGDAEMLAAAYGHSEE